MSGYQWFAVAYIAWTCLMLGVHIGRTWERAKHANPTPGLGAYDARAHEGRYP